MPDLTALAQYGSEGIAVCMLICFTIVGLKLIKVFSNHLNHSTEAVGKLVESIDNNSVVLARHNEVLSTVREVMRNCQKVNL